MTFNRKGWEPKATPGVTGHGIPTGATVFGRWARGEAAFIYQTPQGVCGGHVVGLLSVGGGSLDEVAAEAERFADQNADYRRDRCPPGSWGDADQRMTRKAFHAFLAT